MSSSSGVSSSDSDGKSRRSATANRIITLAGLGGTKKTSSSSSYGSNTKTFPSFRFSPENEEIQEILSVSVNSVDEDNGVGGSSSSVLDEAPSTGGGEELLIPLSESLPSSPKPGETSPIKEYIRKNWTNKWDKKSLSLDLDFRGKIKTAIEDKRKSIVSHFIPEETGLVVPSSSVSVIPEHTGITLMNNSGNIGSGTEVSSNTSSSSTTTKSDNRIFTFDNSTQKVTSNISQHSNIVVVMGPTTARAHHSDDYEEIGVDFIASLEHQDSMEDLLLAEQVDLNNLNWIYSPTNCVEKFEGVLTNIESEVSTSTTLRCQSDEPELISSLAKSIMFDIFQHFLFKYFIVLLGAAILLPHNSFLTAFLWFICGILFTTIVSQSFSNGNSYGNIETKSMESNYKNSGESSTTSTSTVLGNNSSISSIPLYESELLSLKLSPKSQGWMLLFDGHYNPRVITFHQTDPVFIRLDSSNLYISTPSPKYRIPRRKLWNDPQFNHDIKFFRHTVYNLSGAQIFIAPEKLATKRVWNKKYPIGVRFGNSSFSWHVIRAPDPSTSSSLSTPAEVNSTLLSRGGSTNSLKDIESDGSTPIQHLTSGDKKNSSMNLIKGDKDFSRRDLEGKVFYLFSRTCREKEDWYRRLIGASKINQIRNQPGNSSGSRAPTPIPDLQEDYLRFMQNIIPNFENCLQEGSNGKKEHGKLKESTSVDSDESQAGSSSRDTPPEELLDLESIMTVPQSPMFLNAILGRLLYDAVRSPFWSLQLQNMIQRKLNFVKRPPFVELLIVKDLDLGGSFPVIQRASTPIIDSRGLWIDLDMTYEGNFCLTLETKINLLKLRRSPTNDEEIIDYEVGYEDEDTTSGTSDEILVGNLYDSDAEDSGESSEEEIDAEAFLRNYPDENSLRTGDSFQSNGSNSTLPVQPSKGAKFLKMVEKVATSNFVSEMKVVKSAIGKVANTPLLLTVEVKQASGTIAVNIPSPPTNRVWIGFRTKPMMKLITTPRVGERSVNLTPLTDWIQRKIHQQIQRVLVLPNMDDITIKLMEFKLPA